MRSCVGHAILIVEVPNLKTPNARRATHVLITLALTCAGCTGEVSGETRDAAVARDAIASDAIASDARSPGDAGAPFDAQGADARVEPPGDGGGPDAGPPIPGSTPIDCALVACLYVTPSGRGAMDGTSWADALDGLPRALRRGTTYLLADGDYGDHLFDDAPRGGASIVVRKAWEDDHGSSEGWISGDGNAQAVFTGMQIHADDYVFDGVRRDANWRSGALGQYGIRTGNVRLDDGSGTGADRVLFRFVDLHGGGRDTGDGDDVVYGLTGNTDITFESCALHDSDRTIFLMRGDWTRLRVDHSYIARNTSTPETHGEALSMTSSTQVTFSHNTFEDIEGTAVFAGLNDGVATDWKIFGNTFTHTEAYHADSGRRSGHNVGITGIVFCANDASNRNTCNDFLVLNNTIVRITGLWSGVVIQDGTGNVVENNLWFDCVRTGSGGARAGFNWYFDTRVDGDDSDTQEVCTGDCDVFMDLARRDLRLSSATEPGRSLEAPFSTDPEGRPRGADGVWDRGAFEH